MPQTIDSTIAADAARRPSCSRIAGIALVPMVSAMRRATATRNWIFTAKRICD